MILRTDLDRAFNPNAVAIVGVSGGNQMPGDYSGLKFLKYLKKAGFKGRIYPINPKAVREIEGTKVYPNLLSIPEHLDLVIITVKAAAVPKVLEECVAVKAMDVHICTSGFGETGEAEGKALEARLAEIAHKAGLRVCGPNAIGYHVPASRMMMYGGAPLTGPVAFATQSGGCGWNFILQCAARGIGVSKVISFGNALTLDANDYLEYLAEDPQTSIICMYLEGINDGRRFTELVREINPRKPVIIWKGGITESGARAAATHTGSLAGDERIWDAFFRQTRATRVTSVEEMADTVATFLKLKPFTGRRAAVFGSGGGGANVARGDICVTEGIDVPPFSRHTRKELMKFLSLVNQSVMNPMDTPFMLHNNSDMEKTIKLIAADRSIDILIININTLSLHEMSKGDGQGLRDFKECVVKCTREDLNGKPMVLALMDPGNHGGVRELASKLREANIVVYETLRDACRALSRVARYHEFVSTNATSASLHFKT